ncbi:hypothetical protein YC2023_082110 [Brassica napus]
MVLLGSCNDSFPLAIDGGIDEAAEEASAQKKSVSLQIQAAVTIEAAEDYARRFESGINELSSLTIKLVTVGVKIGHDGINSGNRVPVMETEHVENNASEFLSAESSESKKLFLMPLA